jgi:photosystem II stability/assembly factor-like uncharacterized protein
MSTESNNVVAQAFQDWEDASGIDFEKLGDAGNTVWPNEDGITQMLIADPTLLGGASALTQRFIGTGSVVETDVGFQSSLMGGSNDEFKLSIARHEIGHMLGLQHVEKSTSLMFSTILLGTAKPIDQGSLDGITFLYGEPAGIRNLNAAYHDTLGTGIRSQPADNRVTLLAFNPGNDEIYAQSDAVWRSLDGGKSWIEIAAPVAPLASGVAVTTDGRIWEYPSSPPITNYRSAPDDPKTLYGTDQFVVYRSTDSGETWTFLSATPFVNFVGSFVIQNAQTVFIATNLGVYKTIDSGDNWIQLSVGLPEDSATAGALAQDPSQPATMYASSTGGVFKTSNGGINWSKVGVGLGATSVTDLTIDAQGKAYAVTGVGAFVLSDDGETWEQLNEDLGTYQVYELLVDPQDTRLILVATRDGIFRSEDRGASFTQVFPVMDPAIVLGASSPAFGDVEVGKTGSASIDITNDGLGALVISSIATDVTGLNLSESPVTIQPGETATVTLRPMA